MGETARLFAHARARASPPGQRLSNLEAELRGDNVGEAKVERPGATFGTRAIGPAMQKQLPIVQRNVQHDAGSDLESETCSDPGDTTPGIQAPLVTVDGSTERCSQIR